MKTKSSQQWWQKNCYLANENNERSWPKFPCRWLRCWKSWRPYTQCSSRPCMWGYRPATASTREAPILSIFLYIENAQIIVFNKDFAFLRRKILKTMSTQICHFQVHKGKTEIGHRRQQRLQTIEEWSVFCLPDVKMTCWLMRVTDYSSGTLKLTAHPETNQLSEKVITLTWAT